MNFKGPLPEQVFIINDDTKAAELAEVFEALPNLQKPDIQGGCYAMDISEAHPTHWVICSRWWGQMDPRENGWATWFWPKSLFATIDDVITELKKKPEPFSNSHDTRTLDPHITQKLSEARNLNDAAKVWIEHPYDLIDYIFVISSPGPSNVPWRASINLEGGGFLRSIFAHDQLHFASHEILSKMSMEETIQIPIDYSIGFDINAAQYLRRMIEGKTHDPIIRFRHSLQLLANRRFNWELFPFLQERSESIMEGRDLQDIWDVVHASEYFAHCDMDHFSATGELQCEATANDITTKTRSILSDWHVYLNNGEIERIRHQHQMLNILLLKIAHLYRSNPASSQAGNNLAKLIVFMCGEVGVNLPWMMWAADKLFEQGGRFEPLRKLTKPVGSLADNCRNISWDFMHYHFRRRQIQSLGREGTFLVPYTLTFDKGLAALFSGHGQRSCIIHKDDAMRQFFAEYDPQTDIVDKYANCPSLVAAFSKYLTIEAHLGRKRRLENNKHSDRKPLLDQLLRQINALN